GSPGIERDGTIPPGVVFRYAAGHFAAFIQEGAHDVRVQDYFHAVPIARAQTRVGAVHWERDAGRQAGPATPAAPTGASAPPTARDIRVQRRRDSHLSAARAQLVALQLMPLRIER